MQWNRMTIQSAIHALPNNYKTKQKYGNIGDYIQSLAALQYLPNNCSPIFIDRDSFQFYNGENVKLIMNGWYRIFNGNKLFLFI